MRQVFISRKPAYVARAAFAIFSVVLCVIFFAGRVIRYREVIHARTTIAFAGSDANTILAEICEAPEVMKKLAPLQEVQLRLDNYSFQTSGSLSGLVMEISHDETNGNSIIHIRLQNGWKSTLQRNLVLIPGLKGELLITTMDARLMEKFTKFKS